MSDALTLRIIGLSFRGDGLGVEASSEASDERPPAWRVPKTLPGELVLARPIEEARGRRAQLMRVLEASPDRVDPECVLDAGCPGCQLRALRRQLEHKVQAWQASWRRLGARPCAWDPPRSALRDQGYRVRARGRIGVVAGGPAVAMRGLPGADDIALAACPAQDPGLNLLLAAVVEVASMVVPAESLPERLPWVSAEVAPDTGQARVELGSSLDQEPLQKIAEALAERGATTVLAAPGTPEEPPSPKAMRPLVGDGSIEVVGPEGRRLLVPRRAWYSATPSNAALVHEVIMEHVGRAGPVGRVLEIGCGVGTHTASLAEVAARVIALDASREAIAGAQVNLAAAMEGGHLELRLGRAQKALRRLLARGDQADLVVLHGMRKPYGPRVCEAIKALGPRMVLVVSPSVMGLAKDGAALQDLGYTCERVVPIDTMPYTYHMMAVACFVAPAQEQ